jgi:EAL domain-containing protein (putative c-di-GMP-specific phosphodiesterase class I)
MMTTMETRSEFALPGKPVAEFAPVVDLSDGRLLGMEAGVSWEHPEHGAIPSHRLVPWAQKNGEIVPIGSWLAATACLEALRWTPSVQLAVRVTLPQLARGHGSLAIRRALDESGLHAGRVTVEVPESAITDESALVDLVALAGLDVELAVYDVGAALPSFEPLSSLGIGAVKIDGELTKGLSVDGGMSHLVVEAVIDMAHAQGLSVLVEGMTTAAEVEAAAHHGVEAGQGPFFSPLLDADGAAALGGAEELPHFSLVALPDTTDVPEGVAAGEDGGPVRGKPAAVAGTDADPGSGAGERGASDVRDEAELSGVTEEPHPTPSGADKGEAAGEAPPVEAAGRGARTQSTSRAASAKSSAKVSSKKPSRTPPSKRPHGNGKGGNDPTAGTDGS